MAGQDTIVSHMFVKVGGKDLERSIQSRILEVNVDQHVHLPGMFLIRLYDPGMELLDKGPFNLAAVVEIHSKTPDGKLVKLIDGEVIALEPEFGTGMVASLVVRGYDRSHRLYRMPRSKTYLNVKDSDLAAQVARRLGLKSQIETTATVYDHLYQCNQSDLHFLQHRAWRIGYECFLDEETLHFHRPAARKAQIKLAWGQDLLAFHPRLTVAEQAKESLVRGWDVQKKAAIVGRAQSGDLYPKIKEQKNGAAWSDDFGGNRQVIVDQPVVSQAEANILATARQNELSGAYIEAEGEAFRRPDLRAGQVLTVEGLGKRLSGDYLVTQVRHVYTDEGLKSYFSVTGARTGLLFDALHAVPAAPDWTGLVPAIVTNTDDPNGWGRVKVKFPWLSDEEESDWARLVVVGGGPACGLAAVPAVDDEVMVAFQHGDFGHPVVLGGLWNGKDALPEAVRDAPAGEKPLVRSWHSRTGHRITVYDNGDNRLELVTAAGHTIALDDAEKRITIRSAGGLEVVMDDNAGRISVVSGGDVEVKAQNGLTLKGASVTVEASGDMNLKASGQVNVKGSMVNLN